MLARLRNSFIPTFSCSLKAINLARYSFYTGTKNTFLRIIITSEEESTRPNLRLGFLLLLETIRLLMPFTGWVVIMLVLFCLLFARIGE